MDFHEMGKIDGGVPVNMAPEINSIDKWVVANPMP